MAFPGKKLSLWRRIQRITQDQLAREIGITREQLSKIENCKAEPQAGTIRQMAEVFGVKAVELEDLLNNVIGEQGQPPRVLPNDASETRRLFHDFCHRGLMDSDQAEDAALHHFMQMKDSDRREAIDRFLRWRDDLPVNIQMSSGFVARANKAAMQKKKPHAGFNAKKNENQ